MGSSVSQFSLCLPLRPKLMQRAPIFAGQWPLHFHLRLRDATTMSFVFVLWFISAFVTLSLHTTCSILRSISADMSGASSFASSWATMFGHRIKGPGKHSIPERLSVSLVSGICRSIKKNRLLTFFQATAILFYISFPWFSRNEIFLPRFLLMRLTNFVILMNDTQYYKSIYRPNSSSAHTIPWMTCLKGLERKQQRHTCTYPRRTRETYGSQTRGNRVWIREMKCTLRTLAKIEERVETGTEFILTTSISGPLFLS